MLYRCGRNERAADQGVSVCATARHLRSAAMKRTDCAIIVEQEQAIDDGP
jgi:hypothetical protein